MKAGFIGLGAMGGAMARSLLRAGYRLSVFDTEPSRVTALVDAGASAAASPHDVAQVPGA